MDKPHKTSTKANRRIDVLRSLGHSLDRRSLEKLYLSYIRPILEYCNVVWDNYSKSEAENLEAIQLTAARNGTGATRRTQQIAISRYSVGNAGRKKENT